MYVIRRENEWLKEILTIEKGKERLQQHSSYGCVTEQGVTAHKSCDCAFCVNSRIANQG
jgi:hypothetical protein